MHRKVSFHTQVKDRLFHLEYTYLKNIRDNLSYPNLEFVLIDFNSSDDVEGWVRDNLIQYVRGGLVKFYQNKTFEYYLHSRCKNVGALQCTGDIICNLDGDNTTGEGFAFWLNTLGRNSIATATGAGGKGTGGRIAVAAEHFHALRGYDEAMVFGWGSDDRDFINRARAMGLLEIMTPLKYLGCIHHQDNLREQKHWWPKKFSQKVQRRIMERNSDKRQVNSDFPWGVAELKPVHF